jgi:hypothetical protein
MFADKNMGPVQILKLLRQELNVSGHKTPENIVRNAGNYLSGETLRTSAEVRTSLTRLGRAHIDPAFDIDQMDHKWQYSAPIDAFLLKNQKYDSYAHVHCGKYVYFVSGSVDRARKIRTIKIVKEGALIYRFLIGDPKSKDPQRRHYEGFVMPGENVLFLVGFDKTSFRDLVYFTLRAPDPGTLKDVALLGMQACTLREEGVANARARRTVLIPFSTWAQGGDAYRLSDEVRVWLDQDPASVRMTELLADDD